MKLISRFNEVIKQKKSILLQPSSYDYLQTFNQMIIFMIDLLIVFVTNVLISLFSSFWKRW